uniref:hypothetical protein n=1 Tax=Chrysotila carterae TaxID=13221 RepID=UPI0022F32116|nr:hypothetical protein PKF17_pgp083 [Chrysotila carterae]WAK83166.1 hypothetical protein [Chrysotila carterae]
MSLLIIGGTGTLGRQIAKRALDEGYQVKCLVRNLRRGNFLRDWGAELVYGDLTLPATIPPSLKGVRVVIDASTVRPTDDYNAQKCDWRGKLALLEASKLAGIKSFVFFSFLNAEQNTDVPLLDLKVKFIEKLKQSNINSKVFECSGFFQGLIEQYAIPILDSQTVWLVEKIVPTAYIDTQDAAKVVLNSLAVVERDKTTKTVPLLGPTSWTPEQIIQLCERLSGKKSKISYIPLFVLSSLRTILRSLQFTWNIADRLQFSELLRQNGSILNSTSIFTKDELSTLEQYLQEYFSKILKKLKETNYQQSQKKDISFL